MTPGELLTQISYFLAISSIVVAFALTLIIRRRQRKAEAETGGKP